MMIEIDGNLLDTSKDIAEVNLWYPSGEENISTIEVGLMHVRAADSIRISYDFDRNGYVIKQASVFEWEGDDDACDSDWQEVAFIKAWGRKGKKDGAPQKI